MSDNASIRTLSESLQERLARAPALKPGIYYNLINLQSGTAMDLSGADWRSIIGWPSHTDLNQQWEFASLGAGYSVRCVFTGDSYIHCDNHDGNNYNDYDENDTNSITSNASRQILPVSSESKKKYLKYLAPYADGLRHGAPLVTSAFPIAWEVERAGVDFPVPFSLDPQSPGGQVVGTGLGDGDIVRIRWPQGYVVDLSGWGNNKPGQRVELAKEQSPVHKCQLWRLVECGGRPTRVKMPKVVSNDVSVGVGVTEPEMSQKETQTQADTQTRGSQTVARLFQQNRTEAKPKAEDESQEDAAIANPAQVNPVEPSANPPMRMGTNAKEGSRATAEASTGSITCHTTTTTSATSDSSTTVQGGAAGASIPIPSKSRVPELGYTICSMCRRITSNAEADAETIFTTAPPGYEVRGAKRGQPTSRKLESEQEQEHEESQGIANGSDSDHAPATSSKSAQPEWDLLSDSDVSSVTTSENDTEAFYSEREEAQEVAKDRSNSSISGPGARTDGVTAASTTSRKVEVEEPVVDVKVDEDDGSFMVTTTTKTITTTVSVTRVRRK